jgi:hypothetical protein
LLAGCSNDKTILVEKTFIDSLLLHYQPSALAKANKEELRFWKERINPQLPGITNETRYAAALATQFHLQGDIRNIKTADSLMRETDTVFNHKEASPSFLLVNYSLLQHRFKEADHFAQKAIAIGLKPYETFSISFDVDFEMGRYSNASLDLKQMQSARDYGYYFRQSKMDHLNGSLDSAIQSMLHAATIESTNPWLQQIAWSNAADLNIHAGNLQEATRFYTQCVRMNSNDFHSITGLGWIALVHDKNDSLAERVFRFVYSKYKMPDPLFKLSQVAAARGDSVAQYEYARQFETMATDSLYGGMYNKYLVEIYTGILKQPAKAMVLAKKELDNRATPQTYTWYAWSLAAAGYKEDAYKIYTDHISGKPLEGPELYQAGKLMQVLDKGYNVQLFFKEAYKNKYDLSPDVVRDIERVLH